MAAFGPIVHVLYPRRPPAGGEARRGRTRRRASAGVSDHDDRHTAGEAARKAELEALFREWDVRDGEPGGDVDDEPGGREGYIRQLRYGVRLRLIVSCVLLLVTGFVMYSTRHELGYLLESDTPQDLGSLRERWIAGERTLPVEDNSYVSLGDLVIQLAQPRTLKVLVGLVHELPRLEPLLAQLDQIPGLIALAVDTVDELIAKAQANGHRVEDIVRNAFLAAGKVVGLLESPQVVGLLESGILAPEALAVVSQASHALAAASAGPSGRAGLFALWRASRKPEFQRATDFLVRFAGAFGHRLEGGPAALPAAQDQLKLPHLP